MFFKPLRSVLASSAIVLGLANCGGKAEHQPELADSAADSGPAYGIADANGQDGSAAAPSTVRNGGAGEDIDSHALAQCEPGFQGFSAQLGDMHVNLFAFVFEPGDYQGDPIKILDVEVTRGSGEHYRASAGTANADGTISLHVDGVRPRFVGRVVASLPSTDDALRAPLMLDLSFDIAPATNCGGKR
jgi:hypothetical protein